MHSQPPTIESDQSQLFTESEIAHRLKTTVASIRWMRRTGRLSYLKIAGNRKVRFEWSQVLRDLQASGWRVAAEGHEQRPRLTLSARPEAASEASKSRRAAAADGHRSEETAPNP